MNQTLAFFGGGNMAEAIFGGLLSQCVLTPDRVIVSDIDETRLLTVKSAYGVRVVLNDPANNHGLASCAREADILVLAVKPQFARDVLLSTAPVVRERRPLVISIMGGVTLAALEAELPDVPVVRVMPNLPLLVKAGASGVSAGRHVTPEQLRLTLSFFSALGEAYALPEHLIDPLTGVSGCGPAFAFLCMEAMADGGVAEGLPRDLAIQLAAQTLIGAGKMVLETGKHPAKLKDEVCSPGGSTIAGVAELERGAFRGLLIAAVTRSVARMREIGRKSG